MSRTCVLVKSFNERRQLFAVRELPDGSLTVIFKIAQSQFGGEGLQDVKDYHVTAHTRAQHRDIQGYNIKHTMLSKADVVFDSFLIVEDKKGRGLLWPMIHVLSSALLGDSYKYNPRRYDKEIDLIGFMGIDETLCFTIYVSDKTTEMPRVQGFGMHVMDFGKLRLTIYYCFLHFPNNNFSLVQAHEQGITRKNYVVIKEDRPVVPRMTTNGIERFLQRMHYGLAETYCIIANASPAMSGGGARKYRIGPGSFSRWPVLNDEIHEAFGVGSRLTNEIYFSPLTVDGIPKPPGWDVRGPIKVIANTDEALAKAGVAPRLPRNPKGSTTKR